MTLSRMHELDPVARLDQVDRHSLPPDGGELYNRLIFEKSPYLLQHAENPVDWYPWGEEAFARARAEEKPVFLSIGYSTCHWCHVMAHDSFADETVARILNRDFVAIKVDREERPDIDSTYMAACQLLTGSGGWPLTLILTPEKEPFFAATFIPKSSRMGMVGLIDILGKISDSWRSNRLNLQKTGEEVRRSLLRLQERFVESHPPSDAPLRMASAQYLRTFDRHHAGFGQAPKFPAPHNLSLLLRLASRFDDENARIMALQTLQQIRLGGIYDQLGYGLHRYSVDERWLLPHFEKMLYDQAIAAMAYLEAYLVTQDPFFSQTVREILDYLLRDLRHPEGAFFCGEDADSEGREGAFYLWTPEEVREILGDELGSLFCRSFNITASGHLDGKSIPHLPEDMQGLADRAGIDAANLAGLLAEGRQRLFAARTGRIRPHRDDKILSGWNGLAMAGLARAGAHLGEPALIDAANRAADFILTRLRRSDGRLLRRWRRGEAAIPAFLEDYAFLVWGLTELFLAGFDHRRLEVARELTEAMLELFAADGGGFLDSGADVDAPLLRGSSLQDGAIPSGSSVAALNLLRLGRLTGNAEMEARGEKLVAASLEQVKRYPSAYAQMLIALDYALGPRSEIVLVAGDDPTGLDPFLAELRKRFLPRTMIVVTPRDADQQPLTAPLAAGKGSIDGKTTAWFCRESTCLAPVTEVEALERLLAGKDPEG